MEKHNKQAARNKSTEDLQVVRKEISILKSQDVLDNKKRNNANFNTYKHDLANKIIEKQSRAEKVKE